ncbi:MAG: hypothetical protein GY939_18185 [Actinomycetia bacterium]|nr:hypothetical protein [Actinomycetes bacterium]
MKEVDLQMLAMQTGRERTEVEIRNLFTSAGFELTTMHPTAPPLSVIVGTPR